MAGIFPIFEVPIIPPDLRQEESLVQIADCLDYLSKAANTVFDCIDARIKENKKKMNDLEGRIITAKMKVEKLKGVKKATQIFSSAKYPASDIYKNYQSIFHDVSKVNFTPSNLKSLEMCALSKDRMLLEEKIQFFHVKETRTDSDKDSKITEGVGDLPSNIESMSSLLLFNTSENPYERYVTLDPMGVVNKLRKNLNEDVPNQMEAAPISITRYDELEEQVKENYFYSPSLGVVPNIDAPLDLPDLPGIADDLRYSLDLGPGFAPSVTTTPAAPDLPTIPEDSFKDLKFEKNEIAQPGLPQSVVNALSSSPSLPSESESILPPPPLPLPLSLPQPPLPLSSPPPPPPPPPPLPPPSPSSSSSSSSPPPLLSLMKVQLPEKETHSSPAMIHATSNDARANLMAAIRNAGGKAKLRPIQGGRDESKRIKDEKKLASSGGDLMADLHNKLLLRRKGISGKKEIAPGISAMDKVSAMIPPPVLSEMSSATEEDDWEE